MIEFLLGKDGLTLLLSAAGMLGGGYLALRRYLDSHRKEEVDDRALFRRELIEEINRLKAENAELREDRDKLTNRVVQLERDFVQTERIKLERDMLEVARAKIEGRFLETERDRLMLLGRVEDLEAALQGRQRLAGPRLTAGD